MTITLLLKGHNVQIKSAWTPRRVSVRLSRVSVSGSAGDMKDRSVYTAAKLISSHQEDIPSSTMS